MKRPASGSYGECGSLNINPHAHFYLNMEDVRQVDNNGEITCKIANIRATGKSRVCQEMSQNIAEIKRPLLWSSSSCLMRRRRRRSLVSFS